MPGLDLLVPSGQLVMAGVEKIFEHAEQIEIHKARPVVEHERLVRQHHLEWKQPFLKLLEPEFLILAPLVEAAAAELALLVPEKRKLFGQRDKFLPINVVEPERRAFDLVFDAAPEDGLHVAPFVREQSEFEFLVEILGDDLRIVVDFKNHILAVADDRHAVITLLRQFPDQRAVLVWNVCDFERRAGKFQNAPLHDAKRTPRNLNQFNHVENLLAYTFNLSRALAADKPKSRN